MMIARNQETQVDNVVESEYLEICRNSVNVNHASI